MMCRMPRPSRPETDRRVEASRQRALARTTGPRASAPGAPAAVVGAAEPADELEQAVRTARRAAATRATRLGSQGEQARAVAPVVAASSVRSSSSEACPSARGRISVAGAFAGAKTPSPSLVRPPVRARPLESPKARRQSTVVRRMVRPRRWRLRRFPQSARRWSGAEDTPRPCRRVRPPRRRALLRLIPRGLIPRAISSGVSTGVSASARSSTTVSSGTSIGDGSMAGNSWTALGAAARMFSSAMTSSSGGRS